MKKKLHGNSKYEPKYCKEMIDYFDIDPYKIVATSDYTNPKTKKIEIRYKKLPNDLPFIRDFAKKIGVTAMTLRTWIDIHPDFLASYRECQIIQAKILNTNTLLGLYNPGYAQFLAKNILNYRDKSKEEALSDKEQWEALLVKARELEPAVLRRLAYGQPESLN